MKKILICIAPILAIQFASNGHCNPQIEKLTLPKGFTLSLYTDEVPNARQMAIGAAGTVFVGTRKEGKIYAAVDKDQNKHAEKIYIIDKNLNMPSGIAFQNGSLYVAAVNRILRYDNIEQHLDNPPKPVIISDKLPDNTHHGWKYIDFGPDGFLYVPVGAPCNTCLEDNPIYASILRLHPKSGKWTIHAQGIRNSVGFAWHPITKEMWFTDNGRDWWGDDKPPCEINRITFPGQHFGFPYFYGDDIKDEEFGKNMSASSFTKPALNLRAHVAPLGILFYNGDMFPKKYKNQIFYAEHGSWNRSTPIGYRVANVFLNNKSEVIATQDFVSGFLSSNKAWGRPVALLQMPDGAILISDDHAGAIYRVSYK